MQGGRLLFVLFWYVFKVLNYSYSASLHNELLVTQSHLEWILLAPCRYPYSLALSGYTSLTSIGRTCVSGFLWRLRQLCPLIQHA